jgi:glycine cleavage system protein P-like pyridoxal-binding family
LYFFISENLTKYRTELVKKLSQLKYSRQVYTYWTSDGRMYVKQTETSKKQTVNNFDDIMNYVRKKNDKNFNITFYGQLP